MSNYLALLFVLCAVPAWAQQPVRVTNLPTCTIGSCTATEASPSVAVDPVTGLPVEFNTIVQVDTPWDSAIDGFLGICRGKTASVDEASSDDYFIAQTCDQYGNVRTMLSKGGFDVPFCNLVYTGAPSADAVVISASGTTYICSIHIDAEGTVDTRIISGTGSTCGTSTTQMSPLYAFSTTTGVLGTNEGGGLGMIMKSDASEDVCIDVSAGVVNNVRITYAQY